MRVIVDPTLYKDGQSFIEAGFMGSEKRWEGCRICRQYSAKRPPDQIQRLRRSSNLSTTAIPLQ